MALLGRLGRRLLTLAFVLCAFASVTLARPANAAPATPAPTSYIVVDADRGKVLAVKNEHEPHLTASTVKLLTALTALEKVPLDSTVPVSARAASQPAMKISMLAGQVWPLNDVLHAVLMESANDAAFAIAERASGSIEQFAKDAQATAKRLGAQNVTFGDPAGLDDANSFAGGTRMSAYDLAIVARNVLAVPELANISKTMSYSLTDPAGVPRQFANHNKGFLSTYPGAIGLKTGYTKAAGRTLVTAATRNGRTMIAVVFGTWDDSGWSSHLLDQGFSSAADSPGTGVTLPPVRTVTADARLAAFGGLPSALGLTGSSSAVGSAGGTKVAAPTTTPPTTAAKSSTERNPTPVGDSGGTSVLATPASATTDAGSPGLLGTIFTLRSFLLVVFVVLLTVFLLRRRAVRRQRARRIARHKRMAEIRRRRMIDVVDPAEVVDDVSHVRVVPAPARSTAV